jgi:hypothetical protein
MVSLRVSPNQSIPTRSSTVPASTLQKSPRGKRYKGERRCGIPGAFFWDVHLYTQPIHNLGKIEDMYCIQYKINIQYNK